MKKLLEVIRDLDSFDEDDTIYVAAPWVESSSALVATEPDDGGVPRKAKKAGLIYFLEVCVAKEFLEGLDVAAAPEEKCQAVIRYATTDA
jgi:hypothetical protein